MGADLYWKQTPKPIEEEYNGLSMSTWQLLAKLCELTDDNDLSGHILTKNSLMRLKAAYETSKYSTNVDLKGDLYELIQAIDKYDSITLEVRH